MVAPLRWMTVGALAVTMTMGTTAVAGATISAESELSKKEFIKAADDLCRQADEILNEVVSSPELSPPDGGSPTPQQIEDFVEEHLIPVYQQVHDSIEALPEPDADTAKIKKLLKALQKELVALEDDPQAVATVKGPFPKSGKLAKKYGFKVCGSG